MNKMANRRSTHSIIIKWSAAVASASVTVSDGGNMRQCHVSAEKKNAIVPQCNWHYAATGVIVVHYLSFQQLLVFNFSLMPLP